MNCVFKVESVELNTGNALVFKGFEIFELDISSCNLNAIPEFNNITTLNLNSNQIKDISPLLCIRSTLEILDIGCNLIDDIKHLMKVLGSLSLKSVVLK
jgi:Leucine-rich repeat (LRR) protein